MVGVDSECDLKNLLRLDDARLAMPEPVSFATISRWCTIGVQGVKLRTIKLGARTYTRAEWLVEFGETLAGRPPIGTTTQARAKSKQNRLKELARVDARLAMKGI